MGAGAVPLPAVAARRRDCTSTKTKTASAELGPPTTAEGPTSMRITGDPMMIAIAWPRHTRAIVRTRRPPATVRIDELTIMAIAGQTPDERSKTLGTTSGGTTRGVDICLRAPPIHLLPLTDVTSGVVSQGATGRLSPRVGKATTTRAVPNHETSGQHIGTLRR